MWQTDRQFHDLHKDIESLLGKVAEIKVSQDLMLIECKDLDEITTKTEIYKALKMQLGLDSILEWNVIRLHNAHDGIQTAMSQWI